MKKIIAWLLVLVTVVGLAPNLISCSGKSEYVSRSEWITSLAERFGMDRTISETAYFSDVGQEEDYYIYVQSCVDWGVLSNEKSKKFKPKQTATVDFALETAILASGVDIGEQSYVDYAINNGMLKDDGFMSVRGKLTPEIAETIISWTQDMYLNGTVEPRSVVEYKENVTNLNDQVGISKTAEEGTYTVPADVAQALKSGDVLMMPDPDFPDGIAVKVDNVSVSADGTATVKTIEPEIEEVLENLDVAGPVVWDRADIQLAEGVSFADGIDQAAYFDNGQNGYTISSLQSMDEQARMEKLANGIIPDINLNMSFVKGTIAVNPEWDSLLGLGESFSLGGEWNYVATNPDNPDGEGGQRGPGLIADSTSMIPVGSSYGDTAYKNQMAINAYKDGQISLDELKKELKLTEDQQEKNPKVMENKFKAGYDITAGIKISNIKINTEAKYSIFKGIKASLTLDYDVTISGAIKGFVSESLNLMTIRVPVTTGVTVDVKFYICFDANGELAIRVTMDNTTKYSIDGLKVKKSTKTGSVDVSKELNIQVDVGPKIALELNVAGFPIVDLGLKVVARGKLSPKINYKTSFDSGVDEQNREYITIERETVFSITAGIYMPIVILEANVNPKTIANKLKLTGSWTLLGEKKAFFIGVEDKQFVIWSGKLTLTGPEKVTTETDTTAAEVTNTDNGIGIGEQLEIDQYYINMDQGDKAKISVVTLPRGYKSSDLIWTSSNKSVLTVSDGSIKAVSGGIATVTVRTKDGKYYRQCSVSVNEKAIYTVYAFKPSEICSL